MSAITLDTLTLHPHTAWVNEFAESEVVSDMKISLDGTPIVEYGRRKGCIPMILRGGAVDRTFLAALHDLQKLMTVHTLTMQDGRVFHVIFDGKNAIIPTPIGDYHDITMNLYYELELHLIQVEI